MTSRLFKGVLVAVGVSVGCALVTHHGGPIGVVLYAQSVPVQKVLVWDAPDPKQNIAQYVITINGVVQPSVDFITACPLGVTGCSAPVTLPVYGPYNITLVAQNLDLSGANAVGILQSSPASAPVVFSLNTPPTKVTGGGVK